MIYEEPPPGFAPQFEIVSCFLEAEGKILLLKRSPHKPQPETWGIPAGKVERGEERLLAMVRELSEETGHATLPSKLEYLGEVFVRYPEYDFRYHTYRGMLPMRPVVKLNLEEHTKCRWIPPWRALKFPLIPDLDACIKLYYRI